jgi:branched-chain amino acid transport system substrate-binding protein
MANAISDFIIRRLNMNMVGVIAGDGAEHSRMADVVADTMQAKGLTVTFRGSLPSDQTYYGDVVAELKRENPQLVFFSGGIEEAGSLLLQARGGGVESRFIVGFESAGVDLIRMAGEAAEGVYYVSPGRSPGDIEGAETFLEAYQAVSGAPPPGVTAVMAYDATNLLLEAIALSIRQEGAPSRTSVRLALAGIEEYKGVGGNITIVKEDGNGENGVYIYIIEGLSYPGELIYDGAGGGN